MSAAWGPAEASGSLDTGLSRRDCLALVAAASLGACTLHPDEDHAGADAPASRPALAKPAHVAWVFSSGGPRGFVHVGVLKALAELGLRPDLLVGASAGALIGVLCASGLSASRIEELALEVQALEWARLALGSEARLSGAALREWVDEQVPQQLLERLPTPMVCVAQRVDDQAPVGFNVGQVGLAVQAAAAIEGQFAPVRIRGRRYADADLVMPLPVRLARQWGASRVLAVDASAHEDRAPAGAERYRSGDLRKRALTRPDAQAADLVLHPDFGYWVSLSREFRQRAIEAGYRETLRQAGRLRELHAA